MAKVFQSTPSVWRETPVDAAIWLIAWLFQSTPSVWRETLRYSMTHRGRAFQSTPSVWRETDRLIVGRITPIFQSTPSVWRETSGGVPEGLSAVISIHSLRVEGDTSSKKPLTCYKISIHSLRVEGDATHHLPSTYRSRFQSTPSVWRETAAKCRSHLAGDFNPLPPCGGRRSAGVL